MSAAKNNKAKRTASASSSFIDDDMEDDLGSPLVCKNPNSEDISLSELKRAAESSPSRASQPSASKSKKTAHVTPQSLYAKIQKSQDKLFFISYSTPDETKSSPAKWYLVRVDLGTCGELEEAQDCKNSGRYYVEFYNKALDDQSKPDNVSKWWLIWNTFTFKRGNMIIGGATEFDPNKKHAVKKRLVDLVKSGNANKARPQFQPNLERYTTYSDVVNLADDTIRLVGPFDFEAVDLKHIDPEMRVDIGSVLPDDVYVRDLVPMAQWVELKKALKGSKIDPPTIEEDSKKRKRQSTTSNEKKRSKPKNTCELCGKSDFQEFLIFRGTSSLSARHVHKDCGSQSQSSLANGMAAAKMEDISDIFQKTHDSIRQAISSNGKAYCMVDELKNDINQRLDALVNALAKPKNAKGAAKKPNTHVVVECYPESMFDPEDVKYVGFAYYTKEDDPTGLSETNAKIAKLDYDVKKRRERRIARENADDSKKVYSDSRTAPFRFRSEEVQSELKVSAKPTPEQKTENDHYSAATAPTIKRDQVASHPSYSSKQIEDDDYSVGCDQQMKISSYEAKQTTGVLARVQAAKNSEMTSAEPNSSKSSKKSNSRSLSVYKGPHLDIEAEDAAPFLNIPNLPNGWTVRKVPRSGGSNSGFDRYFFSPEGRRFRSKPEVERFLVCLTAAQGNEVEAAKLFAGASKFDTKERKPVKKKEANASTNQVSDHADSNVVEGVEDSSEEETRCDFV